MNYQWQPHLKESDLAHEAGMVMKWFNVFFGRFERHGRYTASSSYNSYQEARDAVLIQDFYVCTVPVWLPIKSEEDVRERLRVFVKGKKSNSGMINPSIG